MKKRAIVLFSMALTACSANNLNQGAERVRITNTEPTGNCTFLGEVTGSQGNFFTGGWTSNSNLETGARNHGKIMNIPVNKGFPEPSKGTPDPSRTSLFCV